MLAKPKNTHTMVYDVVACCGTVHCVHQGFYNFSASESPGGLELLTQLVWGVACERAFLISSLMLLLLLGTIF